MLQATETQEIKNYKSSFEQSCTIYSLYQYCIPSRRLRYPIATSTPILTQLLWINNNYLIELLALRLSTDSATKLKLLPTSKCHREAVSLA